MGVEESWGGALYEATMAHIGAKYVADCLLAIAYARFEFWMFAARERLSTASTASAPRAHVLCIVVCEVNVIK